MAEAGKAKMLATQDTLQRMTPDLAAALTRSLFAGLKDRRHRVAVFLANSDESGTQDPRGEFLVGGYIAAEDYWGSFADRWQRKVLDGPPVIPYLHMNEIRREDWRREQHISDNDTQRRVSEAVLLLSEAGKPDAGSSMILRADLEDVVHQKSKQYRKKPFIGIDEPDYFCFMAYATTVVAHVSVAHPDAKRVDFVVSKKGKITSRLKTFHDELRTIIDPELKDLIGELIPATMEERLPLQAADVLCWHFQRFYAKTMDTTDERRLGILTTDTAGYPHTWERGELEEFTERLFRNFS
jgi:hypothetical protein